jgi:hypothetical protein
MLALGLHDGKRGRQEDVWERVAAIDEELAKVVDDVVLECKHHLFRAERL